MYKPKILIVEDEVLIAKDIQTMLVKMGYDVPVYVHSGEKALEIIEEIHPHLVLMDIVLMGEMDGIETAELVRKQFNIPVVYLTAYADNDTLERAKQTQPFGYLLKPFEDREVKSTIEIALYKHKIEHSLKQREELYRTMFENSPVGSYLASYEGKIFDANQTLVELLGYPDRDSLLSMSLSKIYIDPEDYKKKQEKIMNEGIFRHFKTKWKDYRNNIIYVQQHIKKIPDNMDQIVLYEGIVENISNLKYQENIELKNKDIFKEIFNGMHIGATIIEAFEDGKDFVVVAGNKAYEKIEEIKEDEIVGKSIKNILKKFKELDFLNILQRVWKSGKPEYHSYNKGLDKKTTKWRGVYIYKLSSGEIVSFYNDLTAQKEIEEKLNNTIKELKEQIDELKECTSISVHDLQEPLRMVSSYLQLLSKRYKDKLDQDAIEFITFAVDGINRMKAMTKVLLLYSRLDKQNYTFELIDLNNILGTILDNFKDVIKSNSITINYGSLPTIMANADQINQLFNNLVDNAIKFRTHNNHKVHIWAKQRNDEWLFSIQDNGIGLDQQFADRIFQVFQRLHTRDAYPGIGMGLAICKRIIQNHQGQIWVDSKQGKGATFSFTIPIMRDLTE
jgi:PAS domain S-box-containing protein